MKRRPSVNKRRRMIRIILQFIQTFVGMAAFLIYFLALAWLDSPAFKEEDLLPMALICLGAFGCLIFIGYINGGFEPWEGGGCGR